MQLSKHLASERTETNAVFHCFAWYTCTILFKHDYNSTIYTDGMVLNSLSQIFITPSSPPPRHILPLHDKWERKIKGKNLEQIEVM